jgi:nucleoside-diphosphate-sugar epimerase
VTLEELKTGGYRTSNVYLASKAIAEKAAWKYSEENGIDLATSAYQLIIFATHLLTVGSYSSIRLWPFCS